MATAWPEFQYEILLKAACSVSDVGFNSSTLLLRPGFRGDRTSFTKILFFSQNIGRLVACLKNPSDKLKADYN